MAGENFDEMFASIIKDDNAISAQSGGVKAPDMVNTPAVETPAVETPATPAVETPAVAQAPATDEPPSEIENPDGGEPPPPAETKSATDDALARLADMLSQRQPAEPPPRPAAVPPPPAPFDQQETEFLTQYINDFPDVARGERLIRRAEYNALTQHIFREVAGYFAPKLALLDQLADNTAYSQIVQRVPTYETQRDQVIDWVKTQPAYLQVGMNHVIQQGTAEEIADLFDRFSQATGAGGASPTPGIAPQGGRQPTQPQAPAGGNAAELSPAVKQAAARLAPVNGKRSAPTQAAPLTFEDAFDSFAKAG